MKKHLMEVGESIIIPKFGRFPEEKITCIKIENDNKVLGDLYFFNNGTKFYTQELINNMNLWGVRK